MKLHQHIIRAEATLDRLEADYVPSTMTDRPYDFNPDIDREFRELIQTIRSDLRHIDRKLAA